MLSIFFCNRYRMKMLTRLLKHTERKSEKRWELGALCDIPRQNYEKFRFWSPCKDAYAPSLSISTGDLDGHQFHLPSKVIRDGTRMVRTTRVSNSTAKTRKKLSSLRTVSVEKRSPTKATAMIEPIYRRSRAK